LCHCFAFALFFLAAFPLFVANRKVCTVSRGVRSAL